MIIIKLSTQLHNSINNALIIMSYQHVLTSRKRDVCVIKSTQHKVTLTLIKERNFSE